MRHIVLALIGMLFATSLYAQPVIPVAGQYYPPGGGPPAAAQGVEQVGIDSITSQRCMIGETTTCLIPTSSSGGGGGNVVVTGPLGTQTIGASVAITACAGCFPDLGTGAAPAANTVLWALTNASAPLIAAINGPIPACTPGTNCGQIGYVIQDLSSPVTTLVLPATTTAYASGSLIASSATPGSIVVPHFTTLNTNSTTGVIIPRLRLTTNDSTSTAWGGVLIVVDLWLAAPTFTNGDRGVYSPATGTANHIAAFDCTMGTEFTSGDGAYSECAPEVGNYAFITGLTSGNIYWTLHTGSASGVTGAGKTFTLTPEIMN